MIARDKKIIYDIITNSDFSIQEKYNKIVEFFPNYLENTDEKKVIYEKIEGIFHDGLGTYFELLLFDEINNYYSLNLEESNKNSTIDKMNNGKELYMKFFSNNEYNLDLEKEKENIENGAKLSLELIKNKVGDNGITNLTHSAGDFANGNARDIYITLENGKEINYSLKTDKSGKVAISDGQTPKIFEKVYNRYFNLTEEEYKNLKLELFETEEENIIFEDFQNIALLTQKVFIKQFKLKNVEINNFKNAKITNLDNLKYFIFQLIKYKNGKDNALVILVNRLTGNIGFESILDSIIDVNLEDFSFNPHKPRNNYNYGSTLGIKYKGKTFITFQIKHKRGKNPSNKFGDITIRIEEK